MQEAASRGSSSVDGKFDRTGRIGNCRRGRMLRGKALDAHVNVEAELKTWPSPICVLNFIFASIVPVNPCQIAIVSCHIREVERHLNICKMLCGELGAVHVTRCDDMVGVKVVHLRIQMLKYERQEVRVGVDLELYIRREGEVGRSAAKLCCDGLVEPARGRCKRFRAVDGEVRYAWDDKSKGDSDDRADCENDEYDRASGEPFATE